MFGSIFAGAVHDFIAGFISLRRDGASLPEIHGAYLGNGAKQVMRYFTVLLMILVGAVFVNTPAVLLNNNFTPDWNIFIWVGIIFAYYLVATLLPIEGEPNDHIMGIEIATLSDFFMLFAIMAGLASVILFCIKPILKKMMKS